MAEQSPKIGGHAHVYSDEFRKTLLHKVTSIEGFECIVNNSSQPRGIGACDIGPSVIAAAKNIISSLPMAELRVARQHFNSAHLLAFWEQYNELLKKGIAGGAISKQFPLFTVEPDRVCRTLHLQKISPEFLCSGFFRGTHAESNSFRYIPMPTHKARQAYVDKEDVLRSLHGRLAHVLYLARQTLTFVYYKFLSEERLAESAVWEAYQLHVFFDAFLYDPDNPGFGQSPFDMIFFVSNLSELILYLREAINLKLLLDISNLIDFLKKQTKFNLRLSQEISLEDNHVRNWHREFLQYDPELGVVRMKDTPVQLLDEARQLFRETLQIDDLGCPFGRVKGVQKNALVEIYNYFDGLFLHAIERSWEFKVLTGAVHSR